MMLKIHQNKQSQDVVFLQIKKQFKLRVNLHLGNLEPRQMIEFVKPIQ